MTTSDSSPASAPLSWVERLARQLGTAATAQAVFGPPVAQEGVTVIPVARAWYGFGGGGGTGQQGPEAGGGSGGGGGVALSPIGYIEIREGKTRFRRIRPSVVPLVAVSGLVALALLRSVPRLLPGRRA